VTHYDAMLPDTTFLASLETLALATHRPVSGGHSTGQPALHHDGFLPQASLYPKSQPGIHPVDTLGGQIQRWTRRVQVGGGLGLRQPDMVIAVTEERTVRLGMFPSDQTEE
ncbi:hypothetical protein ACFOPQ_10250, partial [Deinococcus antarcticus]